MPMTNDVVGPHSGASVGGGGLGGRLALEIFFGFWFLVWDFSGTFKRFLLYKRALGSAIGVFSFFLNGKLVLTWCISFAE